MRPTSPRRGERPCAPTGGTVNARESILAALAESGPLTLTGLAGELPQYQLSSLRLAVATLVRRHLVVTTGRPTVYQIAAILPSNPRIH
jgi:hypothetical protein